jgi:hypothetical protein
MSGCEEFDTADLPGCREVIAELQKAYIALTTGNKRVRVRFENRWTEYNPGQSTRLMELINVIWAQCPDTSGLMDFNPARRAQRGAPAFLRIR